MNAKPLLFGALMLAASAVGQARAEERQVGYVQLAELDIDPAQLESYEADAKDKFKWRYGSNPASLLSIALPTKTIPVISEYSKCTKISMRTRYTLNPRILKKYKAATQAMVKSLNLVPMNPIILGTKGSGGANRS